MRTTNLVTCVLAFVLLSEGALAQSQVVTGLNFRSGHNTLRLEAPPLTGNVVVTLPSVPGQLLVAGSAWELGAMTGLPGPAVLGTSDATDVQLITNGTPRIHINGEAGLDQGFVGIGTPTPATQLAIAGGLTLVPNAVVDIDAAASSVVTIGNQSVIVVANSAANTPFANNAAITLTDGLANGHLLIVRNAGPQAVRLFDADANINIAAANRTLGTGDVLMLLWYGTEWHEIGFSNN